MKLFKKKEVYSEQIVTDIVKDFNGNNVRMYKFEMIDNVNNM